MKLACNADLRIARQVPVALRSAELGCVDLFCGVGGLTHGLSRAGVPVLAGIDIDPHCRFPYEANNASLFVEADVSTFSATDMDGLYGGAELRLLAGCAPCQPFSSYSRKGRGTRNDTKWDLVSHFGRIVREAKPDFVTMENVPQLLDHKVFESFLADLECYSTWYGVVECAEYGVPQRRKRLVLLASRHGPIQLLGPEQTVGGCGTVREAIHHLPLIEAGESAPSDPLHRASRLSELNLRRIAASRPGGTWRDWAEELVAGCHRKSSGQTYPSVYGRMEWDNPAPTITTQCFGYGNGRFGHPEQHRAISLREAAILQTFPDDYCFLSEGERPRFSILGRLIGNAVPVRLGEVIGESLLRHVDQIVQEAI